MRKRSRHSPKDYELGFDTHAEVRQAFSYLDDVAPPSLDLPKATRLAPFKRKHRTRQRAIHTAAASVVAVALAGGAFVTNTYGSATKSTDFTSTQDTASSAPIQNQSYPEPILDSEYTNIHRDSFGELWGIHSGIENHGAIGRSTDDGKTWSVTLTAAPDEQWSVLDVSSDDEVRVATIEGGFADSELIGDKAVAEMGDVTLYTLNRADDTWLPETHLRHLYRDQPAGHLVLTNDADRGWVGELRE